MAIADRHADRHRRRHLARRIRATHASSATVIRFVNDILLSAPSIVLGLFVYTLVVMQIGGISPAWPARSRSRFIVLPVVVRTTDEMLRLVPSQMREAALSLGVPQWKVTMQVLYRARAAGHRHRRAAGAGAHQRRNRAAAVHRAQQPVLEREHHCADGERAGGDLPVRDEPVRNLAASWPGPARSWSPLFVLLVSLGARARIAARRNKDVAMTEAAPPCLDPPDPAMNDVRRTDRRAQIAATSAADAARRREAGRAQPRFLLRRVPRAEERSTSTSPRSA